MKITFKHVPVTDPLCQELQGGHSNYHDGLILTDAPIVEDSQGEWLIGPFDLAAFTCAPYDPGYVSTAKGYANVHPFWESMAHRIQRYDGLRVFGIRFYIESCEECGIYHDTGSAHRWNQRLICNSCQLEMDLDVAQSAEIAFHNRGDM
mgnify:FL=1